MTLRDVVINEITRASNCGRVNIVDPITELDDSMADILQDLTIFDGTVLRMSGHFDLSYKADWEIGIFVPARDAGDLTQEYVVRRTGGYVSYPISAPEPEEEFDENGNQVSPYEYHYTGGFPEEAPF